MGEQCVKIQINLIPGINSFPCETRGQRENMLISRGWRHGILECRRENMRSHNFVSCDNKRQSRKAQMRVSRNIYPFFFFKADKWSSSALRAACEIQWESRTQLGCEASSTDDGCAEGSQSSCKYFRAEKHNSGANTQLFSPLISPGQYPAFLKAGLSATHSFLLNLLNSGDFTSQI